MILKTDPRPKNPEKERQSKDEVCKVEMSPCKPQETRLEVGSV